MEENTNLEETFGQRLNRGFKVVLRTILRMLLAIALGIILGAVLFFGLIQREYDKTTVQKTTQIEEVNTRLERNLDEQRQRVEALEPRLTKLEGQIQNYNESFSELDARLDILEKTVAGQGQTLAKLDQIQKQLDKLQADLKQNQQSVGNIQENLDSNENPMAVLYRDVEVVKAMELLTRSRFFLSQNNIGLATQDIQAANVIFKSLLPQAPDYQQSTIKVVIDRLNQALENLPGFPVMASDDLDIVWQILIAGLPKSAQTRPAEGVETETPAGEATVTTTGTPVPTPWMPVP